jgi:hypothetical protein
MVSVDCERVNDAVEIADEILALTRRLEQLPAGDPRADGVEAEIAERRARLAASTDFDSADLRRRLEALRAEADRIRSRRIDIVKQVGGGAAGGAGWDGPITQWLNTKMDSAAGLPELEREIGDLERLLEDHS